MANNDLVAFLKARLDEREHAARKTTEEEYAWNVGISTSYGSIDHAELHTPSWALRDVEAKRRILNEYETASAYYAENRSAPAGELHGLLTAVSLLALPYADHDGYQESWKP